MINGDILCITKRRGVLRETEAKFYIVELILALEFLHSNNIIHKNIKPDNILLQNDGHIAVTDYGLESIEHGTNNSSFISVANEYMAPELIMGVECTNAVDYWSLGVLLYRLLVGRTPFICKDKAKLPSTILSRKVDYPPMLSNECVDLLKGLLHKNTNQRLGSSQSERGLAELKAHPFFMVFL